MLLYPSPPPGYDDGDCCQCTCVSTTAHTCGDIANGGFECLDPRAPCTDDDDGFFFDDDMMGSFSYDDSCIDGAIGDGDCDELNNNDACGTSGFSPYIDVSDRVP